MTLPFEKDIPDPWRCQICGEHNPTQDMARRCEAKHDRETAPPPTHRAPESPTESPTEPPTIE